MRHCLGTKYGSSARTASVLNRLVKAPAPQTCIFVVVCWKCGWGCPSLAGPSHIPSRPLHLQTHSISAPQCQREYEQATQEAGKKKITFAKWIVFHPLDECDAFFASGLHTEGM